MKTLKDKLINLAQQLELGQSENEIYHELTNIIHNKYKAKMLPLFLRIQQLEVDRVKKEKILLYKGLEDGMHNSVSLAKHLLEDKTSRQAKEYAKFLFIEDNIAMMINIIKAYFPDGNADGASNNGKWFFKTFVNLLKKHKHKYLPKGSSYGWVQMFEHEDYINLILKNET